MAKIVIMVKRKKNLSERCNFVFLKLLKKLTDDERSYLIKNLLSDHAVDILSSIVFNGIHCDFNIPSKTRKRVRKQLGKQQAANLEYASVKSNPVGKRRTHLSQAG